MEQKSVVGMEKEERKSGGIYIKEGEKDTYIYLCGIKPTRNIHVNDFVEILPTTASPLPDDMIDSIMKNGSGSEFELGMLIATLRLTSALLKIKNSNARELAIMAWNAQWIAVYIGAILNCEVAWYFQANKPAYLFSAETKIRMISSNMQKIPSSLMVIDEEKCQYLENKLSVALELDKDERFATAANALWSHRWNPKPAVQLSVLWAGIEALFLIERGIKAKLSKAASNFIFGCDAMVDEIRVLYEGRCKAVHEMKADGVDLVEKSARLLNTLILTCIEKESLPNTDELLR